MSANGFSAECRAAGVKFARSKGPKSLQKEAASIAKAAPMAELYRAGCTLEQIGQQFGITRERVRQLMTKHFGIRAEDGGASVLKQRADEMRRQKREQKSWAKNGCSYADYTALVRMEKPTRAYASQKRNANMRGIPWDLTLWQWWTIWQQSGKWEERGRRGDAFVMCRKNDMGPYSPENVYIATLRHNSSVQPNNPYRVGHPDHEKLVPLIAEKLRRAREGRPSRGTRAPSHKKRDKDLPAGVRRSKTPGKFMAAAWLNGKSTYLGSYTTVEAAHQAYLRAVAEVNTAHKREAA